MFKKYKTSKLTKALTLGLKQYGYKLEGRTLIKMGLSPMFIPIDLISTISFELRPSGRAYTYFYVLRDEHGREIVMPYATLDGVVYQELFRDLLKMNPKIKFSDKMREFLITDIKPIVLKLDFNVNTRNFFKRSKEFSMQYPSIDAFIAVIIIFVIFPISILLSGAAYVSMVEKFGVNYEFYRLCAIVISGIAFMIAMTNLFISLVSMYLGHKLTIIALIISTLGLIVGLKT